nr:hypothetical protein [uncultured Flavobacterium sp.]
MKKKIFLFTICILTTALSCNLTKSSNSMKKFNPELLKPTSAQISRLNLEDSESPKKAFKMQVELNSFMFENQKTETCISLDYIPLNIQNIDELENKTFEFPINPKSGYIDGSIYLFNVHNPFDVKKIQFGKITNSTIETSIYYDIVF